MPEIEDICSNCNSPDSDCECWQCEGCDYLYRHYSNQCSRCDRCDDCCGCWECSCRLWYTADERCTNCERCCARCCDCYSCPACDSRVSSSAWCERCDRCDDCCGCSQNTIEFRKGELIYYTARGAKQHARNPLRRHIGLELEFAGCADASHINAIAESWDDAVVKDASLPAGGFEINLNPASGDRLLEHIDEMADALRDSGAHLSDSCGYHVHADARDLGWWDIYKLCALYTRIEPALFRMLPRSRQDNGCAQRVAGNYNFQCWRRFKRDLLSKLYERKNFPAPRRERLRMSASEHADASYYVSLSRMPVHTRGKVEKKVFRERREKYERCRYYALNLHSLFLRGTVEFRHAAGTTNRVKIANWAMLCGHIVEAANRMSLAQIRALAGVDARGRLSGDEATRALRAILPAELAAWVESRQAEIRQKGVWA